MESILVASVPISPDKRSRAVVLCRYVAVVTVLNLVVASFIDGFSTLYDDPEEEESQSDDDTDLEDAGSEEEHAEGAGSETKTEHIESESKPQVDVDPEGEVLAPDDLEGADPNGLHAGSRTNNDESAAVAADPDADNLTELDLSNKH